MVSRGILPLIIVALAAVALLAPMASAGGHGHGHGAAGNVTAGNASTPHPPGGERGRHGNASSVHALVQQVVEPSVTETGGVVRIELRLLDANVSGVNVLEVLPPWLTVLNHTENVEVIEGVVPAHVLSHTCPACFTVHAEHRHMNESRAARGNATGEANATRVEARVWNETRYWGEALLYMGNATLLNITLTPGEPVAVLYVKVAWTPPSRITVLRGIVVAWDGRRAPLAGDTRLLVADAAPLNMSIEGCTLHVKTSAARRIMLAYTPGVKRVVIEASTPDLRHAPPVTLYLYAYNQSGVLNETLEAVIRAGEQALRLVVPAGAAATCCIEYRPVNETPPPPPHTEPLLAYELGPSHNFNKTVVITITLAMRVTNVTVYYWAGDHWEPLPTRLLNTTNGTIEYNTTHFTVFLVATAATATSTGQQEPTETTTSTTRTATSETSTTTTTTTTSTQSTTETTTTTTTTTGETSTATSATVTANPATTTRAAQAQATTQTSTTTENTTPPTATPSSASNTSIYAAAVTAALLAAAAAALLSRR